MVKWVLRRAIDKFERDWNYDASYMRDIIDASPRVAIFPRQCPWTVPARPPRRGW